MIVIYKFFKKMSENTVRFPSQIIEKSSDNKPVVPEQRVRAVVEREDRKINEAKNSILDNRDAVLKMEEKNQEITNQKNEQEANYRQEKKHTNLSEIQRQTKENQFFGLGKLFGKKEREVQRAEDEQKMAEIRSKLEQVTEADKQNQQDLQETNEAISQNEKKAKHAEELVRANELGGPMRTSEGMREALQKQDSVKFYQEAGYPIENADYLLPMPIINKLIDELQKPELSREIDSVDSYFRIKKTVAERKERIESETATQHDIDSFPEDKSWLEKTKESVRNEAIQMVVKMTPFYEEIVKLVDKEKIPLSQNLIVNAMLEGLKITRGISGEYALEAVNFTKQRKGEYISGGDVGYSEVGASQLDKFFSYRKNIQGRNRLPYVLAYGAGALCNKNVMHQALHLRNWLAETIPTPKTEQVRKNGEWVTEQSEPISRGFGHIMLEEPISRGWQITTKDKGWYEAVKEANEICREISQSLRQKRLIDAQRHFTSGFQRYGAQLFEKPSYHGTENIK